MLGVLRAPLRAQRTPFQPCLPFRQLSTSSSHLVFFRSARLLRDTTKQISTIQPSRAFTLGSIFAPRKPSVVPAPQVVGNISSKEAEADANPNDVGKQIALFEALLNSRVPAAYEVVISRWERMCEFVSCTSSLPYRYISCHGL